MSTTAQTVFEQAMRLMGEVDATGATDITDNAEYKNRTLGLLSILQAECYPISDAYAAATSGIRPVLAPLTAFTSEIGLDDGICQAVLPYGLAAHLLLDENATIAAFFNERYEQLKNEFKSVPSEFVAIEDIYGGIEYGSFAAWE